MAKKAFVGNLSFEVTDFDLEDLFKQYGEIVSAKVIIDRDSNRSRGFGFVEMSSDSSLESAIEALNGTEVKGRAINVSLARERTDDRGSGGGFRKKRNYNNY